MSRALGRNRVLLLVGLLFVAAVNAALAGVPDPQLMTDHPVYRGELSCSTLERTIRDAYRVFSERYGHAPRTETEKLTALWVWQCEHHMRNCDPYVYGGVEHPDAPESENGWMETRDQGSSRSASPSATRSTRSSALLWEQLSAT